MNRSLLKWFFLAVQFVMLAVSIPKVAMLFHNYETHPMGPLFGDVDTVSWLVGIAIDLTTTVTTWAALAKYEATTKRISLFSPGVIIAVCSGLSVVANYEDAATVHPEQYAGVSLFTHPALLINPILISAPPLIVLLLILIVPSVLATPRVKSAAEITAATAEQLAIIDANAQLKEAKARANAKVRGAQAVGWKDTLNAVTGRAETAEPSAPLAAAYALPDEPANDTRGEYPHLQEPVANEISERVLTTPSARVSKAMWSAMSLKDRVLKSGVITSTEVAEVLGVGAQHARKLVKDIEKGAVSGRTGVPYDALIDALYARRSPDASAQAHKLERALALKKTRTLHAVGETGDIPTVPLVEEEATG